MCELHEDQLLDTSTEATVQPVSTTPAALNRRRFVLGAAATTVGVVGGGLLTAAPAIAAGTSQNGWTAPVSSSGLNKSFSAGGVTFPAGVRAGYASTILGYVARRFHNEVERLHAPGCWGYAYRPIRGGSTVSNHGSGTAIDVNAPQHPLGKSGTFSRAQVARIRQILAACEGTVRWGGDYSGRKDEMHFEINKRPTDPAIARVARKLGGSTPPPPPPPAPSTWPTLKSGSRGFRVMTAQFLLKHHGRSLSADGVFGAGTKAAVVAFQRSKKLSADGVIGPRTWAVLASTVKQGSRGYQVRAAQIALNAHGAKLRVDGIAGSGTRAAIVAFQRRSRLSADGVVGARTWGALV